MLVLIIENRCLESISRHDYACDVAMLSDDVHEGINLAPHVGDKGICMFRLPKIGCQDKYTGMLFSQHGFRRGGE
jgi:hypothetical protein